MAGESYNRAYGVSKLGDKTFVIKWFAGINYIILQSQIYFYPNALSER